MTIVNEDQPCEKCFLPRELCECDKKFEVASKLSLLEKDAKGKVVQRIVEILREVEPIPVQNLRNRTPKTKIEFKNKLGEKISIVHVLGKPYLSVWVNGGVHTSAFFLNIEDADKFANFILTEKKRMFKLMPKGKVEEEISRNSSVKQVLNRMRRRAGEPEVD